jgi:hypothetical protein
MFVTCVGLFAFGGFRGVLLLLLLLLLFLQRQGTTNVPLPSSIKQKNQPYWKYGKRSTDWWLPLPGQP